jgi:ABC-type Na+ efflux pump permease subunit
MVGMGCSILWRVALMSLALAILDIPMVYVVVVMVLGLPFIVYLLSLPVYMLLQLIPTTLVAYAVIKAILRSGVLRRVKG